MRYLDLSTNNIMSSVIQYKGGGNDVIMRKCLGLSGRRLSQREIAGMWTLSANESEEMFSLS